MNEEVDLGYPKNFFQTNEIIQKIAGIWWPGKGYSFKTKIFYFMYVLVFYSSGLFFLICEFLRFNETVKEMNQLVSHIGMFFTHMVGILKISTLVFRRSTILRIMDNLQDKKYHYEPMGNYRPGDELVKEKSISSTFSIMVFVLYTFVGVLAHVSALININNKPKGREFEGNITCYDYMPYFFRNPFPSDTKMDCIWYGFTFMDIGLGIFAWLISCHDGLFVALLNCLKTQLIILCNVIKSLRLRCVTRLKLPSDQLPLTDELNSTVETELYVQLTHCTEHLKLLLKVRDDMEDIFTFITLAQTLASLLIFASCLYVSSSVSVTSPEFFAQVEYFFCVLLQLSLICWFGNEITTASAAISSAMYEIDWFSSSSRFKTSMIVTMIRMQRPVYLSIGKFTPLTLATLVAVCRGSFSYFALFQSIQ